MSGTVPLALRDKLYRLFIDSLGVPEAVGRFERGAGAILKDSPEQAMYLRDRFPRYEKVLQEWRRHRATAPANLREEVELARHLFMKGLYFDAHEFLEAAWRRSDGELKSQLQGFIQLAAALHKLELDPKANKGAAYLVARGFEKLENI